MGDVSCEVPFSADLLRPKDWVYWTSLTKSQSGKSACPQVDLGNKSLTTAERKTGSPTLHGASHPFASQCQEPHTTGVASSYHRPTEEKPFISSSHIRQITLTALIRFKVCFWRICHNYVKEPLQIKHPQGWLVGKFLICRVTAFLAPFIECLAT